MARHILRGIALALLAFAPVGAQYKARDVSGVVTDLRGNPLPKVAVQIENTKTLLVRSYITGPDGRYHFNELNDDIDFTLKAHYHRFWSKPKTLSKFNAEPHPVVILIIPVD
jgi:hypothetical protein